MSAFHEDPEDRELSRMFRTARRADEGETPRFRRPQPGASSIGARRSFSLLRVAGATLGACALAVLASSPFMLDEVLDSFEVIEPVPPARAERIVPLAKVPAPSPVAVPTAETEKLGTSLATNLEALGYTGSPDEPAAIVAAGEVAQAIPAADAAAQRSLAEPVRPHDLARAVLQNERADTPSLYSTRARKEASSVGAVQSSSHVSTYNRLSTSPTELAPAPEPWREPHARFDTESYRGTDENPFRSVADHPLSTFSADVDTASYTNVRRFLAEGRLPPPDAVRVEEIVNYFRYDYSPPRGAEVFGTDVELASCPWNPSHALARIGIRAKLVARSELAGSNLVFLVDVSGSMADPAKLPLLKEGLRMLATQLDGRDRLSLVVYAGNAGVVLPPTPGNARGAIAAAIEGLEAGGSTAGGAGIELAYRLAVENLLHGGVNRVILATDGDFNVGVTSHGELMRIIRRGAREGVFLTVLGFGSGNYKDDRLERLADEGDGQYAYIDSRAEAQRVLVDQVEGTLVTVARDVKFQVEFNPAHVAAYRLIGYENRALDKEDFNDDAKDAGEVGSGHTVTALYELVPSGSASAPQTTVDPLRYQQQPWTQTAAAATDELFTLKIRYKRPTEDHSELRLFPVSGPIESSGEMSEDFGIAAAAALFGMLLRESALANGADVHDVLALLEPLPPGDERRSELVQLVTTAEPLFARRPEPSLD